MSVIRRFLIVSSLGRLIRKERGGSRITEGYFAPQGGRTSLVRIDGQLCHLVLINVGPSGAATEERTEVPRAHGDALLDVCSGKAVYERTNLTLAPNRDAVIDRYVQPSGVDLVSVSFENDDAAKGFRPPVWFGTEVTGDNAYDRHAIALTGQPEAARLTLNNAMLEALLDVLEPRFGLGRYGGSTNAPNASRPTESDALSRAVASPASQGSTAALPSTTRDSATDSDGQSNDDRSSSEIATSLAAPTQGQVPSQTVPVKAPETGLSASNRPAPPNAPLDDKAEGGKPDARIDDVIESLSQALGAAIQQPPGGARSDDPSGSFERWQVRPRRTQQ